MSLDRAIVRTLLLSIVILGFGAMRPGIISSIVRAQTNGAGSLDPMFGVGGKVTTNVDTRQVTNVALQPDGSIVVVAELSVSQFGVVRYLSDGSLDSNFGTGGIVRTVFTNGSNIPYSVADSTGQRLKHAFHIHRLDQVRIEPGFHGSAHIFGLSVAGQGHQLQ